MLQDQPLELPGIEAKPLRVARGVSQFDITAHFREERQGGIEGFIEYNADLFDPSTIERLLGHWSVVIEAVAANPDLKVSEVPLLSDADRRKMLVEWNATTQPFPSDKGIHHLIAETAAARPDATALVCGDESLTYAELDARANSLARHLKSLGVGRDIAVGLSVKRSLELVVAALAIMKAGGAYVPLDPTYPRVRRGFIIEDTHAPVHVDHLGPCRRSARPRCRGRRD